MSAPLVPRFFRVRQVCQLVGLSKSRVHTAISAGELRAVKLGGVVLVPADALEEFLRRAEPCGPAAVRYGRPGA